MKKFYSVILLAFLMSCGSPKLGELVYDEQRMFTEVIPVPYNDKSEIYVKLNSWFVKNYNELYTEVEYMDKEAGKVMGTFIVDFYDNGYHYIVKQNISLDVKYDKVRMVVSNPRFIIPTSKKHQEYQPLVTMRGINGARKQWKLVEYDLRDYLQTDDTWY